MDELTLLRNLHRDTPGPSAAQTAQARARLLDAIGDPPLRSRLTAPRHHLAALGRRFRRRFWAPVAAAVAVTAVAITAAVIAAPGPRPSRPGPSPRPLTAASVLLRAASAAARQAPGHGRFFATEFENIDIYGSPPSSVVTYWIGNGVSGRLAWLNGRFASSLPLPEAIVAGYGLTWAKLQRLPTAPGQLQADLVKVVRSSGAPEPLAAFEFSLIANLLARAPGSPALRSALYQVAARLPGLALVLHAHDLIGRAAAEVYVPRQQVNIPTGQALYFDPSTGAALDVAGFGPDPHCPDVSQDAVLASGYVGSKYQLPAGAVRNRQAGTSDQHVSWLRGLLHAAALLRHVVGDAWLCDDADTRPGTNADTDARPLIHACRLQGECFRPCPAGVIRPSGANSAARENGS